MEKTRKVVAVILIILLLSLNASTIAVNLINDEELEYIISETDKDITRILPKTEITEFKSKFVEGDRLHIYSDLECTKEVTEGYVGTGMYLKNSESQEIYSLGVIGDINGDGTINQIDLTKLIKHLVELEGCILTGVHKKAADMTFDNNANQIDLTKMIRYIVFAELDVPAAAKVPFQMRLKDANGAKYINDTWTSESVYVSINQQYVEEGINLTYEVTGANIVEAGTTEPTLITNEGISKVILSKEYSDGQIEKKEYTIKIDKSAPTDGKVKMQLNDATGEEYLPNTWANQNVYIEVVDGIDGLSGLKSTTYEVTGANVVEAGTKNSTVLTEEGTSNVIVTSIDNLGNTSTTEFIVKIDKTAPEITQIELKLNDENGEKYIENEWTTENVYVAIIEETGEEDTQTEKTTKTKELSEISYEVTGANTVEAGRTEPIILANEGISTVIFTAKDQANNIVTVTKTIKIDRSITTPGSIKMYSNNIDGKEILTDTWTNQDVYIELVQGIDGLSGLKSTTYEITGAHTVEAGSTETIILTNEGISTITVTTEDNLGNISTTEFIVKIDKTNPQSGGMQFKLNDEVGEEYLAETWTKENVYAELIEGTDELSGILETTYEVLGANTVVAGTTDPITLTNEGETIVRVTTKDIANNIVTELYNVKIDKSITEPGKLIMKLNDETGDEYIQDSWTNKNVYIDIIDVIDELSGPKSTTYEVTGANVVVAGSTEPTTLVNEGVSTVIVTSTDNVQNIETKEYTIKIQKSLPEAGSMDMKINTEDGEEYISNKWTKENVYIKLSDSNVNLGEGFVSTYEVIGANNVPTGTTEPTTLTNEGASIIKVTTVDLAGNTSTREYTVRIDKTMPEAPALNVISGNKVSEDNIWYIDSVTVQATKGTTDGGGSGVGNIMYKVDGPVPVEEREILDLETINLVTDGTYTITAYNYDNAGNRSEDTTITINKDSSIPTGTSMNIINGTLGLNDWYNTNIEAELLIGQDATSGISKLTYKIDGNITKAGEIAGQEANEGAFAIEETEIVSGNKIIMTAEGIFTVTLTTYDNAGNKEEIVKTIKIDKENTIIPTYEITGTLGDNEYYTSDVNVKVNWEEDITSNIARTTYTLSGATEQVETDINNGDTILITNEGTTDITFKLYDGAGNINTVIKQVKKDAVVPNQSDISAKDITGTGFTLVANGNDQTAGVAQYEFYVDGVLYDTIISSDNTVECVVENQTSAIHKAYVVVKDMAGQTIKSTEIDVENSRLAYSDIDYIEFSIDSFSMRDNNNQVVGSGASYLVSDTSLTDRSKYIQVTSTTQNVKGILAGQTKVVRKNGEIVTDLKYYPQDLVFNLSHYSSGSGSTWTHLTNADLYGTPLYNTGHPEETLKDTAVGILDKTNNVFNITEQKQAGTQTYTRIIIQSVMSEGQKVPFKITSKV